jgi:hypothetical protein
MLQKKLFVGLVVVFFFICVTPVWAFMRLDLDRLEVGGEVIGKVISETEMEGMRGAYLINNLVSLATNLYALKGTPPTKLTPSGTTITNLGNNNNNVILSINQTPTPTQNTQINLVTFK